MIRDRLREAILNQIRRDRDQEQVDLSLVKNAIFNFVEMGFIQGDIVKQDDEFVWKGDKNNEMVYVSQFQNQLLSRVIFHDWLLIILDQRVLQLKIAGLVHEP